MCLLSSGDRVSVRDGYLWVMVRYGPVAWRRGVCVCVCVCSFGEGPALWVLLSRVDRDRRAERSGFGYIGLALSDNG